MKRINLVTVLIVAITVASFVAKVKWGYGLYEGR